MSAARQIARKLLVRPTIERHPAWNKYIRGPDMSVRDREAAKLVRHYGKCTMVAQFAPSSMPPLCTVAVVSRSSMLESKPRLFVGILTAVAGDGLTLQFEVLSNLAKSFTRLRFGVCSPMLHSVTRLSDPVDPAATTDCEHAVWRTVETTARNFEVPSLLPPFSYN